ncbi:hypothetical protein [Proteus mirabilis]|uniref:hypothetical protein n=1 Tax=Proteus mirabilis TaxID=584 RepID=UPI0023F9E31A|nr:hypothetical protein [Proteus mirabilis]MDF7326826.1 hypothetical protein [Proteus mirabilis]
MILIIYFITILFIGVWIWNRKNKFALNEESLHKQWLFWLAILFPLFSSLYFMLTLGFGYPPNIDIDGFNNFLNMHKFSLGILTLSPILGAFVVSAHRSIQTAKQIEVTEKKNKVDTYYSKRKFINEQLSTITTKDGEKIKRITSLYLKCFKVGDFNDKKINDLLKDIDESLKHFKCSKIINEGFKTTDSFILYINNPKDKKYINNIAYIFNEADYFISKIKNSLYLENKISVNYFYKKCILKYKELYKNEKFSIIDDTINDDLYLEARHIYIKTFVDAINYINDIINIISEIVIILYPDDNINLLLPNLDGVKNKITNYKNELGNLD